MLGGVDPEGLDFGPLGVGVAEIEIMYEPGMGPNPPRVRRGYRITRKKKHMGDNILTLKCVITGCAVIEGCVSAVYLVIATMHGSAASRGCTNWGGC